MIENQTILCFASGYDAPPTSKHHVMHILAERNVVLWVNYHASRAPTASSSDMLWKWPADIATTTMAGREPKKDLDPNTRLAPCTPRRGLRAFLQHAA